MLALSPSEFNLSLTRALALGLHAVVATLSKPDASLAERRWATSALFRFKPLPLADPIATRPSLAPTPPIVASIETMSIAPAPSSSAEPHIASSAQTAPASKLLKTFSPCGPVAQASRLGVPSPQTLGPRPAAPSLASAPLELAPAPTAEAGAIVTPSAPSISDECEALLTLLGSDRSTREELLAARRGLRDLLDRGPCARLGISRRQHELARLYLAPFG